jgi:hypothetical protein
MARRSVDAMDDLELPRCKSMKLAGGDWACNACSSHNYANTEQCNKCQVNKNVYISKSGWRQGDWICLGCSNHNWADKLNCNKCFAEPTGEAQCQAKHSERAILEKFETTLLRKLEERLKQFAEMVEEQIACAKLDIRKEFMANDGLSDNDHECSDSNSSSGGNESAKKKTAKKKAAKTLKQLEEIEERFVQREKAAKNNEGCETPAKDHLPEHGTDEPAMDKVQDEDDGLRKVDGGQEKMYTKELTEDLKEDDDLKKSRNTKHVKVEKTTLLKYLRAKLTSGQYEQLVEFLEDTKRDAVTYFGRKPLERHGGEADWLSEIRAVADEFAYK